MIIYVSEKSYKCEPDSYSSRRPGDQEVEEQLVVVRHPSRTPVS